MQERPTLAGRSGRWFDFEHEGRLLAFWIDTQPDSIQDVIVRTNSFYELEALQLIRDVLPDQARIIDVGANIGNHAVYFDRICGAAKVYVIEPNLEVIEDLKANAVANDCEAIDYSYTGFAVGSEAGKGRLFITASDDAIRNRGGVSVVEHGSAGGQEVEIRCLDDLDLGTIDFIKIDVEGQSLDVLDGARNLIKRSQPTIFVEIEVPNIPALTAWAIENHYAVSEAIEYHLGIVNFLLISESNSEFTIDGALRPERSASTASAIKPWSALLAEKQRLDRSEETLSYMTNAMRNTVKRAEQAEERVAITQRELQEAQARAEQAEERVAITQGELQEAQARVEQAEERAAITQGELQEAQARAEQAEERVALAEAALQKMTSRQSMWESVFFRASGKPKRAVRRLFFHSSGRPRGELKRFVVHPNGRPRRAFFRWMTSPEYLSLPDLTHHTRRKDFVADDTRNVPKEAAYAKHDETIPKRVLYVDWGYPDPTRDSASIDAINYIKWFVALGYEVHYLSMTYKANQKAETAVLDAGASVLHFSGESGVLDYLRNDGHTIGIFFLSRIHCGGQFLEACRRSNPRAAVIFNTVDLHFLREEREAEIRHDREGLFHARRVRERELYVARQSDLTIVVSTLERDILSAEIPGTPVGVMSLYRELPSKIVNFDKRSGIGFVGGFDHLPNVDAMRYFLTEVWPHVQAIDPNIRFEIAGRDLPKEIARALPPAVVYVDYVADLEDWLGRLRLTVAPLRYGAGAKGKVASSLVNGVPVVGTKVAFEGMELGNNSTVTADDPKDMAREIVRIHSDETSWTGLSREARSFANVNLSPEAGMKCFKEMLDGLPGIGNLSLSRPPNA